MEGRRSLLDVKYKCHYFTVSFDLFESVFKQNQEGPKIQHNTFHWKNHHFWLLHCVLSFKMIINLYIKSAPSEILK